MWILVLTWSGRNTAMNFVALRIVIALVFIASSYGKLPGQKVCCLRGKTRHSSSYRGSIIAFNTEITQVAEVEPGNVVWMPISAIRKRSNIWSCLLPSHSSPLSDTPIRTRLYKLFDKAGKSEACYQPGTLWCTSCWRNADKTFASRTTSLQIVIFKGFHFLLDILGLHTSPIYIINTKAIDHLVSMRRSIT